MDKEVHGGDERGSEGPIEIVACTPGIGQVARRWKLGTRHVECRSTLSDTLAQKRSRLESIPLAQETLQNTKRAPRNAHGKIIDNGGEVSAAPAFSRSTRDLRGVLEIWKGVKVWKSASRLGGTHVFYESRKSIERGRKNSSKPQ